MGFDPEGFWTITPRELDARLRGAAARLRREHDDRAVMSWNIAYLPRAKKPVEIGRLLFNRPKKKHSWQADLAAWQNYVDRQDRKGVR